MEEESGLPKLGTTATKLGIRLGVDIEVDARGDVHLPKLVPGKANGLSCAPDIANLPRFALPIAHGGRNKRTTVWRIQSADLGSELAAQEDTVPGYRRHVSIGPARTMSAKDYVRLIEGTRPLWEKV